jgi:hypothetical protein
MGSTLPTLPRLSINQLNPLYQPPLFLSPLSLTSPPTGREGRQQLLLPLQRRLLRYPG